ncbi:MAG TPA: hypothetical protein PK413_09735, partial [Thermoanaerobaculia bacterium]|nr:hypothetical protein [Thermoanaerobaculia bacterium]
MTVVGLLWLAAAAAGQEPTAREQLDSSAGWGTDPATGQIAIDPTLEVFYDASTGTLVVNPNLVGDAAADLGATIQRDGSWLMPNGSVMNPTPAELAIVVGDEPDGVLESAGLPIVKFTEIQVALVGASPKGSLNRPDCCPQPPPKPTRWRRWYRCGTCTSCFQGCLN